MNRISSNSYFDQTISNIQNSYEKLVELQTQIQSQKAMQRPSDDPVRANQAILLESNLKEIQQYQKNVALGSDNLTFADQTLDSLMVPLNNAIEKVQQGLNAEQDSTSRQAIAAELEAILDTFISVGNTQLGDKNIFGGSNTTGDVFTRLGGDILFNGNNQAFNTAISHSETIKTNITANDVFGTSSTILNSERNLNANLSELSLESGLPIQKTLNTTNFKISGRTTVVQSFQAATGLAVTDAKVTALTTAMDALATTDFATVQAYTKAVRNAASTALKAAASTGSDLSLDESFQIKQVVDAAKKAYLDETSSLSFQAGEHIDSSTLSVTFTSTSTTDTSTSIAAINKAATQAAGVDGTTGDVDNSNVIIDARLEALAAFKAVGNSLSLTTQVDLATQLNTLNNTTLSTTAARAAMTSDTYANAVQDAGVTAFGAASYSALDANGKLQVDAAVQAAKNAFSATEFRASTTRSGMSIRHTHSDQISIDTGASDARLTNAFELAGKNNDSTHVFDVALNASATALAADRKMTITLPDANFVNVQFRAGDTVDVMVRRINRAVNQMGIADDLRKVVASVDSTATSKHLVLTGSTRFKITMDDNTEVSNGSSTVYNSMEAKYRSVSDLRGGNGINTGTHKIMGDNVTTGFANGVTVMEGDSLEYLVNQLNDLAGFDATLNSDNSGIKLSNMAKYAVDVTPTAPLGAGNSFTISATAKGLNTTINLTATTLSQMAEEINARSSTSHYFHAEVNSAGTGLMITSNEAFSMAGTTDTAMTKVTSQVNDFSAYNLIDSDFLSSLGLNRTPDTTGVIEGESIVGRQVRLSELNGGRGVSKGSLRIVLGNTTADIDLSSASTLRDVKVMIETAMPNLVKVNLNDSGNGIALSSVGGGSMRVEELFGGSVGRTLGLIQAPASSASGADIQGGDIDPAFHNKTLIKDLNGGLGIDTAGFVLTNGDKSTTITLDSNGDGVDDIRTLEQLVNHINQKSKQDEVYITAEVDPSNAGLKITSKLSNTSMSITERVANNTMYRATGINESTTTPTTGFVIHPTTGATGAATMTIFNADKSKSLNVSVTANQTAAQIASSINTAAALSTTDFSFRAIVNADGGVDILSDEAITVSDTLTTAYTTNSYTPNPPVMGTTANDLGLLGSFSDSTLLSTLNGGAGIENGTFKIKYGPSASETIIYNTSVASTSTNNLTFYNETGSASATVANPSAITAAETTALQNLGISHLVDTSTSTIKFSASKKFSTLDTTANVNLSIAETKSNSQFTFSSSVSSAGTTALTFYNENATTSVSVANPSSITSTEANNLAAIGISYSIDTATSTLNFTSKDRFSTHQGTTILPLSVATNAFATTAKEVTVDVEFAETLGEVKTAIETATNNEILVTFGPSNRIELRLASGDDTQQIEISETGGSLSTAQTLGLIHPSVAYGRDLRDGITNSLSNATLLSDLGINLGAVATNSGENDLLINTDKGNLTIDITNLRSVGDVLSKINSATVTDAGQAISLEAKVESGRYISISNRNSGTIEVVSTSFSQVAKKLGLVADPELVNESQYQGRDLNPHHQAENFFSALTTLRDQFQTGVIDNSLVSNTLNRLTLLQNKFLAARGDAGGRIGRLDTIQTRYEDEALYIEGLYGDKIGIDVIQTTQRYLQQQQVYESALSVTSRILGTSLFNYI
jgi:flagellar hook-associated protein 3 FlgL